MERGTHLRSIRPPQAPETQEGPNVLQSITTFHIRADQTDCLAFSPNIALCLFVFLSSDTQTHTFTQKQSPIRLITQLIPLQSIIRSWLYIIAESKISGICLVNKKPSRMYYHCSHSFASSSLQSNISTNFSCAPNFICLSGKTIKSGTGLCGKCISCNICPVNLVFRLQL